MSVDCCRAGLCPDWDSWVPENALPNCTEAMDAAEQWLDVPQVQRLLLILVFCLNSQSRTVKFVIIRLEAMLRASIGFTLRGILAVFTRSAITPPKVNRFG